MHDIQVHRNIPDSLLLQILNLWNNEYPLAFNHPDLASFKLYLSELEQLEHLLCFENEKVIGWLMLFNRNGSKQFGMIVSGVHQGKRVGTQLLSIARHRESKLEGWTVAEEGLKKVDGSTYPLPHLFYEKAGFQITDENWKLSDLRANKIYWNSPGELSVVELTAKHLDSLLNYWFNASDAHLLGMGVDLKKMPTRESFRKVLLEQISLGHEQKNSFALICMLNGKAVGHSNINQIQHGSHANMHLHLWDAELRNHGLGMKFIGICIPLFFSEYRLERLLCEPYALNPAPNGLLPKLGFSFVKTYTTVPGSINTEQEVNQWELSRKDVVIPLPSLP